MVLKGGCSGCIQPGDVAARIAGDIRELEERNTPNVRAIRRRHSRRLRFAGGDLVLDIARVLLGRYGHRWVAYELIRDHEAAFQSLSEADLQELGAGMASWGAVDAFARTLSGPAWLHGLISDDLIHRWARSEDRWWRRAALVSTVALNVHSHWGTGDPARTLAVCRQLAADHDDMVVKALSWALRELVVHDADAVERFLVEHEDETAARVKREVRNKLSTGLKNSGRAS